MIIPLKIKHCSCMSKILKCRKPGRTQNIKDIIEYVKKLGVNHIFLQTERELPAYSFYQKVGFKEIEGHASLVKTFD